MTSKILVLVSVLVVVAIVSYILYTEHQQQRQISQLSVQADKFHEVCGTVKAALYVDRQLLTVRESDSAGTALANSTRDQMIMRFGTDRIGDAFVMLGWCLPEPFSMEAWHRCAIDRDYDCLTSLLRRAEDSL